MSSRNATRQAGASKKRLGCIVLFCMIVFLFWPINFVEVFLNRREPVGLQLKIRDSFVVLFHKSQNPPTREKLIACLENATRSRGAGVDGVVYVSGSNVHDMFVIIKITSPGPYGYNTWGALGELKQLTPAEIQQKISMSEKLEF